MQFVYRNADKARIETSNELISISTMSEVLLSPLNVPFGKDLSSPPGEALELQLRQKLPLK
jgi:hypothetical protein